ncbi:hypothetical protein EG328_003673 [Venturia inaequalis]|uniref:Uncharacterized protein n=1 Tax=Venturia inaequalis TaxID=5025 RepID=A0A8H3ZC74_VENIN|nr:hypothetical protein EG328_003673 [Venturia inaequalis]KAE9994195.1 hypothetical protein EG327_000477 [Venturia inaequalis]
MSYRRPYRRGGGAYRGSRPGNRSNDNAAFEEYDGEKLSIRDIQHHFWKSESDGMTGFGEHATLNNAADHKDGLAYILLFRGANPRWQSDKIIFVKSNLDLLPDYYERTDEWIDQYPRDIIEKNVAAEPAPTTSRMMTRDVRLELEDEEKAKASEPTEATEQPKKPSKPSLTELVPIPPLDYTPSVRRPIAVFEQIGGRQSGESFKFAGWFELQHVAIIAPYSEALKRLLAQKWQSEVDKNGEVIIRPRDENRWRDSFEQEWAVVKFYPLQESDEAPPKLVVEKAPPRKSVNDLLAEMKLGKENSDGNAGASTEAEKKIDSEEEKKALQEKQKAPEEKAAQEAAKVGKWAAFGVGGHKEHDELLLEKRRENDRIYDEKKAQEKRDADATADTTLDNPPAEPANDADAPVDASTQIEEQSK